MLCKEPAFPVDENKRSVSSREFKGDMDRWNERPDMGDFNPDRWLFQNDKGETEFNPRSAPMQSFGLGVRSCYGTSASYRVRCFVVGGCDTYYATLLRSKTCLPRDAHDLRIDLMELCT